MRVRRKPSARNKHVHLSDGAVERTFSSTSLSMMYDGPPPSHANGTERRPAPIKRAVHHTPENLQHTGVLDKHVHEAVVDRRLLNACFTSVRVL